MNKVTTLLLLWVLMGGVAVGQSNPCNSANNNCVVLTWSPSTTWGIAGYYIFRGKKPGEESSKPLNTSPVAAGCGNRHLIRRRFWRHEWHYDPPCTWTDNNVREGDTYYYYITAVDVGGVLQSATTKEVTVTVPFNPW